MDYTIIVAMLRKYIKKKYSFRIINDLRVGKPLTEERSVLAMDVLNNMPEDMLEYLLEKMHDDGHIVKDDGRTVTFSTAFVFD